MITECYHIRSRSNLSELIRLSIVRINVKKKVWLAEHHHTEIELGLYLAGSGCYLAGGKELAFGPGDLLLFGSNQEHVICHIDTDKDIVLINVHFDPRLLWESNAASFSQGGLLGFVAGLAQEAYRMTPREPGYEPVRRKLQEIEEEFKNALPEFELAVKSKLLELLILLVRSPGAPIKTPAVRDIQYEHLACLEKATNYILSNLSEPLTLNCLAKQANVSRSYLCSLFKKINGVSIWEYITIKRVDLAIRYLLETQEPITRIGEMCGFNTSANFNRAFRKITSQSPSEFRRHGSHYN